MSFYHDVRAMSCCHDVETFERILSMGELMDFQVQETLVGLREALMIYLQHQNVRQ